MSNDGERVIVLGAGVSGMTIANELADRGRQVIVIDDYDHAGGNHLSWDIGPYTFDIGTIYFPEHSPIADLVPDVRDHWVRGKHTVERITPSGVVRHYPLSLRHELLNRSPMYIATVGGQILAQKLRFRQPRSVSGFLRYYIGDRMLQDSGLLFFMRRFYNLPVDEVGFSLAKRRMTWISDHAGLRVQTRGLLAKIARLARGKSAAVPDQWFAKAWYVRPRAGFAAMYEPAVRQLEAKGVAVRLNARLSRIERTDMGFDVITDGETLSCTRLVSTVPLEIAGRLLGLATTAAPRSSPLMTLCLRFRGKRGFEAEVLYNFHKVGAWKRLTMHSDFYGPADGWEYLAVEVTLPREGGAADEKFAEFRSMTRSVGLFDGELEMVGNFVTPFAYPIYDAGSAAARDTMLARLHALGVETVGRQGSFEYVPVASEAIDAARGHVASRDAARRT